MLLEDSDGPYLYIRGETPQPRKAFLCKMHERCIDSALPFPTYILEACHDSDVILGRRFAITFPYAFDGLKAPQSLIPVHTYRDLADVMSEYAPGDRVLERGSIVPV